MNMSTNICDISFLAKVRYVFQKKKKKEKLSSNKIRINDRLDDRSNN